MVKKNGDFVYRSQLKICDDLLKFSTKSCPKVSLGNHDNVFYAFPISL